MQTNVIETEGLTKTFSGFSAVDSIYLRVPQGSIYGFLGPNGAGKTTTIRMLLGLIRPTAGAVHLFGQTDTTVSAFDICRRVGSLVESPSYYPHLTGRENLELVRRLRDTESSEVNRVLAMIGLEKDRHRLVRHYSLGMCQRLGLGMALLGKTDLLVLDEPTNGLDPAGIHEIRELLCKLSQEQGITVFVSSHMLAEIEQIATCIGIVRQGKLIFQGTPDALRQASSTSLHIRVDRPESACELLQMDGWEASCATDHSLTVTARQPADAATLNTRLVTGGFRVSELHQEQMTLENIFLQLTQAHSSHTPLPRS
jgi:lantibiotic transport system ATP-binding protein